MHSPAANADPALSVALPGVDKVPLLPGASVTSSLAGGAGGSSGATGEPLALAADSAPVPADFMAATLKA